MYEATYTCDAFLGARKGATELALSVASEGACSFHT